MLAAPRGTGKLTLTGSTVLDKATWLKSSKILEDPMPCSTRKTRLAEQERQPPAVQSRRLTSVQAAKGESNLARQTVPPPAGTAVGAQGISEFARAEQLASIVLRHTSQEVRLCGQELFVICQVLQGSTGQSLPSRCSAIADRLQPHAFSTYIGCVFPARRWNLTSQAAGCKHLRQGSCQAT